MGINQSNNISWKQVDWFHFSVTQEKAQILAPFLILFNAVEVLFLVYNEWEVHFYFMFLNPHSCIFGLLHATLNSLIEYSFKMRNDLFNLIIRKITKTYELKQSIHRSQKVKSIRLYPVKLLSHSFLYYLWTIFASSLIIFNQNVVLVEFLLVL